jgi:hypothetical protein
MLLFILISLSACSAKFNSTQAKVSSVGDASNSGAEEENHLPVPPPTSVHESHEPAPSPAPLPPQLPTPSPSPAPAPMPVQVPAPAPVPVPVPAPSPVALGPMNPPSTGIMGLLDIPSNFILNSILQKSWGSGAIAPLNSNDVIGAFRFICGPGQLLYDDPIVFPGQPGASHLHQFFGNMTANANSTYPLLRGNGDSTCNFTKQGIAANRSAYWAPALLDGKGNVVQPEYYQVYYKGKPAIECDPSSPNYSGVCAPIPNGLRFVFGFNMANPTGGTDGGHFKCIGTGSVAGTWPNLLPAKASCQPGNQLVMALSTPKCWNGQVDSTDHRSHMAAMIRNASTNWIAKCPESHPYVLPQFTLSAFYRIKAGDDLDLFSLSSDAMFPNLPRGSTIHADYFEAWDNIAKKMWTDGCVRQKLNCSGGDMGNGLQLIGAMSGTIPVAPGRVPVPPKPASASSMHMGMDM